MKGRSLAEVAAGADRARASPRSSSAMRCCIAAAARSRPRACGCSASFDRIDGLANGADVRIAGVKVGTVTDSRIDPESFARGTDLKVDR